MIFDLHNDLLTADITIHEKINYLNDAIIHKNANIILAAWTTRINCIETKLLISEFLDFITANEKQLVNKIYIALEDLHFIDYENLESIVNLPLKYCGLTWNYENVIAGGCLSDGSLTSLGKITIERLERKKIFIDVAHLNKKSFWQVQKTIKSQILCSHTCFESVNKHIRNLDNDQIKAIIDSNGLIGLTLVRDFLTDNDFATIDDVFKQIDFFTQKFGYENLAIGTDFNGTLNLPIGLNSYINFDQLKEKLIVNGYTNECIESIFHKNAINFFNI